MSSSITCHYSTGLSGVPPCRTAMIVGRLTQYRILSSGTEVPNIRVPIGVYRTARRSGLHLCRRPSRAVLLGSARNILVVVTVGNGDAGVYYAAGTTEQTVTDSVVDSCVTVYNV